MARLLGGTQGAISQVTFFVPAHEARAYAPVYAALIGAMPRGVEFHLAAVSAAIPDIKRWPCDTARLTIHDIGETDITPWACDPWLAGEGDGAPVLLIAPGLERREDSAAALRLAEMAGFAVHRSQAPFEGGNVLVGDDFVLVGADTLAEPSEVGAARFAAVLADFEGKPRRIVPIDSGPDMPREHRHTAKAGDEDWTEVFHFRNAAGTRQPAFHIDMYVTLAGKAADGREQVLVGDPAMAARLLGHEPHRLCLADAFDGVAADLAAQGFAVIRNPMPMIYMDEPEQCRRTWYYASTNNALVQVSESAGNVVWLPQFGHDNWPELAITDLANRAIWEELGFEVRMIGNAQRLAENAGGLHCLTNLLARS